MTHDEEVRVEELRPMMEICEEAKAEKVGTFNFSQENFFTQKLDNLSNKRLAEDDLVDRIRKLLAAIAPLIGDGEGDVIPSENVTRIHKMTRDTVAAIASKGA